jgi:hypothetical protein
LLRWEHGAGDAESFGDDRGIWFETMDGDAVGERLSELLRRG